MNKAEMMFRSFFESGAEYVLFHLAHRVQIERVWTDGADGLRVCWDEVRVLDDDDDELAVFDDKPNLIQADAMVAQIQANVVNAVAAHLPERLPGF